MNNRKGFTLIELLLALALTAILTTSLYTSLFTCYRAHQKLEEQLKPSREVNFALDLLAADLTSSLPPRGILAGPFSGSMTQTLTGDLSHSLSFFLRPAPTLQIATGIIKVEYLLSEENEPKLLRRLTVNLLSPEVVPPVEEVICKNISSFVIRYYDGSQWLDSWDSTTQNDTLPLAVEITIEQKNTQAEKQSQLYRRLVHLPAATSPEETTSAEATTS